MRSRLAHDSPRKLAASGFTLTEMMVGLALGMVVTAVAGTAFLLCRAAYLATAERSLLEERGQRTLSILSLLIRQGGWRPDPAASAPAQPAISGADNCGQPSMAAIPGCGKPGVAGSDALLIRFSGSGQARDAAMPDQTMIDCSGYAVAAQGPDTSAGANYVAANLVYVAIASDGEPQLLCRYPARRNGRIDGSGWTSGAIVRGVESMQIRYGLREHDQKPGIFLRADEVSALGEDAWHRVTAVQIALAFRLEGRSATPPGMQATATHAHIDNAIADALDTLPGYSRNTWRVFATTIRVRNMPQCLETLC
ncbi:PilW family protein [Cupriavidus sp. WKF15]|uniref:PilW family protein n=1 Tax=Cupriavidus sp. WKF15 TaxID=3032282 RepID=UPI0023E2F2AE|nr:PilW family protein [Cupriavidus sp. WKF15]WER45114.1 PilW family protein [Cupriavidus sp. WKF15]